MPDLALCSARGPAPRIGFERPACAPRPRFRVLDASAPEDSAAWRALWERWPQREIMAHPEYVRLFARPCDRVVCAVGEDAGGVTMFPLLLRPLNAERWAGPGERRLDATTPYGYGGPFTWGDGPREHAGFWSAYAAWCAGEGVVTTFARLSLFEDQLAPIPDGVEVRAPNIAVPLEGGEDALWRGYDTRVRRWIRVAEGAGLRVQADPTGQRLDGFLAVYDHTMRRHDADDWYFFPRAFFEQLLERLPGHCLYFHTLRGEQVVSSDLVLCSAESVYYFLGGTLTDAFPLGANYLLKHTIARWALEHGKRRYVLGGGYTPCDGVFRYKRGWARHGELPFRVACLEHDRGAAAELRERREAFAARAGAPWAPHPGFFPAYRG